MFLLCIRLNIVILERDYTCIAASSNDSKEEGLTRVLHYADVILDERCGILLHPLDQLTSPEGFKMVTTRVTTLSLQYERLWILLYTSESGRLLEWESCAHALTHLHKHPLGETICVHMRAVCGGQLPPVPLQQHLAGGNGVRHVNLKHATHFVSVHWSVA